MTEHSPHSNPNETDTLSQKEAKRLEWIVSLVGTAVFILLAVGIYYVAKQVANKPLPPPSFVPTGDVAAQSEIAEIERINLIQRKAKEAHEEKIRREAMNDEEAEPPVSVIDRPQQGDIDGAPPQPVFQTQDTLQLKNPHRDYDRPIGMYDNDPKWRTVRGIVTAHAPRTDRMSDGSSRKNLYARTEFYSKEDNMNCYFHQYMGAVATLQVNEYVLVQYDPTASDACSTAHIVK